MPRPQTIQIYLPAGDPRGMRVAEITTRIVRALMATQIPPLLATSNSPTLSAA